MSTGTDGGMTPNPNANRPARSIWVSTALMLTAVLFILAVSILCYRWIIDREPSSLIILNGSDALEGVVAQVSGVGLAQPVRATFDPKEKYILRFHVAAGNYTLSLIRDGQSFAQQDFTIPTRQVLTLDLWRMYPSTRPASTPAQPDVEN